MSEGPKLYANKPKKAQRKQYQQQQASAPSSIESSGSSTGSQAAITPAPPPPSPTPPPQPPKESFARRYKFLWPLLLAVNFTVGAYLFTRTKKKDVGTEEAESPDVPSTPVSISAAIATVTEKSPTPPPVVEPAKLHAPIPEDQQHELFKWMLEERRRVKPTDPEEKKRIDGEKAILKQFIRTKTIPSL
ncbi:WAS WASL-interacting family member 3-like [Olea europaea subsp. europaea]|uniref:WAS WASL-interacting family member 3-like n=1 Tax=Olea europaea subsp. europaea TaxID=158383 RepID=A0A8S0RZ54_OLEEU|nr:WAS WASL-interacting family member 3-like [Olea europaea subsp. europaea]